MSEVNDKGVETRGLDNGGDALARAMEQLGVHDHLCLIYETREDQFAAVIPFMRSGLERRERCVYIADDNTAEAVTEAMAAAGLDVQGAIQSGQLSLLSKRETYLKEGHFDPDGIIGFLRIATDKTKAAGFSALRATGEMTWVLGGDPGTERLMEYESKLNYFFPQKDILAICQYSLNRFSPELIRDVISTHPLVICGGMVCKNFYYIPPDDFLGGERPDKEIGRLLDNIQSRVRVEESLRESEEKYRQLLVCAGVGVGYWDRRGRLLLLNPAAAETMGGRPEDFVGKTAKELFGDDTGALIQARNKLAAESELGQVYEDFVRLKTGGRWFSSHYNRVLNGRGNVVGVQIISNDITDRRMTDETLRKSEVRYRSLYEQMLDAFVRVSMDGHIVECNDAYCNLTGYTRAELADLTTIDLTPSKWHDMERRIVEDHILTKGDSGLYEKEYRRKDGAIVPVELRSYLDRDTEGHPASIWAIIRDVTERKRAEIENARISRALRMLSGTNQALIQITNEAALLDKVCRTAVEAGGYRMVWVGCAEEDEAKTLRPVAHAGFESGYFEEATFSWTDGVHGRGPCGTAACTGQAILSRDISTDSSYAPWHEAAALRGYRSVIALPLSTEARTIGVLAIYSEDSDAFDAGEIGILKELADDLAFGVSALRTRAKRDLAEEALHKREADLKEAQRLARIGSWDWDATTDTITWSEEYCAIYGLDPSVHPPGYEEHLKAYAPESAARLDAAVKESMRAGTPYKLDLEQVQPDGTARWITARGDIRRDARGQIVGLYGTAQDITERKRQEEEIARLNAELAHLLKKRTLQLEFTSGELDDFSYSISHDLRAPLRSIDGWSAALLEDYGEKLDATARGYLETVRAETKLMGQLVDGLLEISKASKHEMKREPLDLAEVARSLVVSLKRAEPARDMEIVIPGRVIADGDPGLLRLVLKNLLENAWKFTKTRGHGVVEFGAMDRDGAPAYFVRDNGVGFDPKFAYKLFKPFQHLHRSEEYPGSAVGLATVQRVIHRHGGRVWAEGEEGKGASFYFTLG